MLLPALLLAVPAQWTFVDEIKLTAPGPGTGGDQLGHAVALDGDTLVAGAPYDTLGTRSGVGSATVFERVNGTWVHRQTLVASDGEAEDLFGETVDISGDRILIGARASELIGVVGGAAYAFERVGTTWTETQKLEDEANQDFGTAVALEGDTAVVSSSARVGLPPYNAVVYRHDGSVWNREAVLMTNDGESLGDSAAISGDTIAIGSTQAFNGAGRSGAVYVFSRQGTVWAEQAKLFPSDLTSVWRFGSSVALAGDLLVAGDLFFGVTPPDTGAAWVFRRSGTSWVEEKKLEASDPFSDARFGTSVSVKGNVVLVGAPQAQTTFGKKSGAAYFFRSAQGTWPQLTKITTSQPQDWDQFGDGVDLDGPRGVIGMPRHDTATEVDAGQVQVIWYYRGGTIATNYCAPGTSSSGCQATISAHGVPSASAPSGFSLLAQGGESKNGMFYFGSNGRQGLPWGNTSSSQCVVPPVTRVGIQTPGGALCEAVFVRDLNARWCPTCPKPAQNPGAGAVVQAQLWYRDPFSTGNNTSALSDAVEFTVTP